MRRHFRRAIWFSVGALALIAGAIGIVLPLLPTTPFVILAAFAFARSAPSISRWLESHRTFGPMILQWRRHGAIEPRYKALAIVMMVTVLLVSVVASVSGTLLAVQAVCMMAAATFILTRPNGPAVA